VIRTTVAALAQLDPVLLEASASLGASQALFVPPASRCRSFGPGVLAGGFIAFMSSFDNVPVSLFLRERAHRHAADPHVGRTSRASSTLRSRHARRVLVFTIAMYDPDGAGEAAIVEKAALAAANSENPLG
jgi:ABC-type Fe3+ transport system permease subunit